MNLLATLAAPHPFVSGLLTNSLGAAAVPSLTAFMSSSLAASAHVPAADSPGTESLRAAIARKHRRREQKEARKKAKRKKAKSKKKREKSKKKGRSEHNHSMTRGPRNSRGEGESGEKARGTREKQREKKEQPNNRTTNHDSKHSHNSDAAEVVEEVADKSLPETKELKMVQGEPHPNKNGRSLITQTSGAVPPAQEEEQTKEQTTADLPQAQAAAQPAQAQTQGKGQAADGGMLSVPPLPLSPPPYMCSPICLSPGECTCERGPRISSASLVGWEPKKKSYVPVTLAAYPLSRKTTCVVLPPGNQWKQFVDIKRNHMKPGLLRPPFPHITLMQPFVDAKHFSVAKEVLHAVLSSKAPFHVDMSKFKSFQQQHSSTLYLDPTSQPLGSLEMLAVALKKAVPQSTYRFKAHVGLGFFKDPDKAAKLARIYQRDWKRLDHDVSHIYFLSREEDNLPWTIQDAVPIGPDAGFPDVPLGSLTSLESQLACISNRAGR